MIRRARHLALLVILVTGAAAPLSAANKEYLQLMADLRMLQEQNQQMQVILGSLTDALKLVNGKIDDQTGATRKAFADQRLLVDTLSGEVRIVREKLDDANVRIASLSQELEALRLAIPPMSGGFMSAEQATAGAPGDPAAAPPGAPGAPGAPGTPPAVAPGQSPQRLFDTAWADYTAGQWTLAIEGFQQYLKSFPRSPKAGEAQTYIGDAYLADNKYNEALAAYEQVIQSYATSDAVPVAYYKRGLALERLNQMDRARDSYNVVVQKYPNTQAGTLAKQALERVNRPGR